MAPLEGITTFVFRQTYSSHFRGFDKYFTPFLTSKNLSKKERGEVLPEHNEGMVLIPQILSNIPDTFADIVRVIKSYGYDTVNLNLGCPSGTVVAKNRGSGQLRDLNKLEAFLDEIFEKNDIKISIKTRIGLSDEMYWEDILNLYKKYPLEELIIHPRLREDWYKGTPRLDAFQKALDAGFKCPICYNGDIVSKESFDAVIKRFSSTTKVMIGRGVIGNPNVLEEICSDDSKESKEKTRIFLEDLTDRYVEHYGNDGDLNVLHKMKDIWNYVGPKYEGKDKELKAIRKADTVSEYRIAAKNFFRD